MKPIVRIGYLIDQHEDYHRKQNNIPLEEPSISYKKCTGCVICDEIEKLSIACGLKVRKGSKESSKKPKAKVEKNMGKITFTYEEYKKLREQGLDDKTIAKRYGVTTAAISYRVKKWEGKSESSEKVAPLKVKDAAPVRDHTEYATVINDLKAKLKYSEQVVEGKDELNREYADKNMRLATDNVYLSAENEKLIAQIEQLEKEVSDLHAAADDVEKEYLKKEEQLLTDVEVYKLQARTYQAENNRLNDTLTDVRKDTDKHKGEAILFRSVLKAVL